MSRKTLKLKKNQKITAEDLSRADLTVLEIFGDSLTELPIELSGLTQLTNLHLISKNLISIGVDAFELPKIKQVKIKFGLFTSLPALTHESTVKTIFCTDGSLQELTEQIYLCQALEILVLNSNAIISLPKNLSLLKNLRRLVLDNNKLTTFPFLRTDFPKLNHLSLEGNHFDDEAKAHIFKEFRISL